MPTRPPFLDPIISCQRFEERAGEGLNPRGVPLCQNRPRLVAFHLEKKPPKRCHLDDRQAGLILDPSSFPKEPSFGPNEPDKAPCRLGKTLDLCVRLNKRI